MYWVVLDSIDKHEDQNVVEKILKKISKEFC